MLIGYFAYLGALSRFFPERPHLHLQLISIALGVVALELALSWAERGKFQRTIGYVRDWSPIPLTLVGFQVMEFFVPRSFDHRLESQWIRQDVYLLKDLHLRAAIEVFGPVFPSYLELCYLLVYGLAAYGVGLLYATGNRKSVNTFLVFYLAGTLGAYAFFPFFPSEPPRALYRTTVPPTVTTCVRLVNLWILKRGTIHLGVFPSAHVSSAFAAAWGMFFVLPRKRTGWLLLIYACSVSLATVYGRYHYAADCWAGMAVSVVTGAVCWWSLRLSSRPTPLWRR
jgi:membrane-associated phospholipid phosphatase